MLYFFFTSRQFLHAASVYNVYLLRAQTQRASGRIHRYIAAAYDRHLTVLLDRRIGTFFVCLHQIDSRQELIGRIYTIQRLARNSHKTRQSRSGSDKYSFISHFIHQLVDGQHLTDYAVALYIHAQRLQAVHFLLHNTLGQTELRNTIDQHAARQMKRLIDRYRVSLFRQISGTCQACRTCSDHRDLMAIRLWSDRRFRRIGIMPVCYKTLQTADSNRIALDTAHALALALALLRAYTTAYRRKRAGLRDYLIGSLKIFLFDLTDKVRDLDRYRTPLDTGHIFTIQAPLRLIQSNLFGISQRYLQEILIPNIRILRRHRILLQRHIRHDYSTSFLNRLQVSS